MKCIICGEKFYDQTYTEPAEPCDCGQCITAEAAEQMTEDELAAARDHWEVVQDEDEQEHKRKP